MKWYLVARAILFHCGVSTTFPPLHRRQEIIYFFKLLAILDLEYTLLYNRPNSLERKDCNFRIFEIQSILKWENVCDKCYHICWKMRRNISFRSCNGLYNELKTKQMIPIKQLYPTVILLRTMSFSNKINICATINHIWL